MSKIFIDLGAKPWEPSASTRMVSVLDFYNFPLAGILSQNIVGGDEKFLFVCAAGEEDDTNMWFYAPVTDREIDDLQNSSEATIVRKIANALKNKMLAGAVAYNFEVIGLDEIDSGIEEPGVLVRRFLRKQQARASSAANGMESLIKESEQSAKTDLALA